MIGTADERMEAARHHFRELAAEQRDPRKGALYEHLFDMAESIQEVIRTLDYIKIQVEEIRQELKSH